MPLLVYKCCLCVLSPYPLVIKSDCHYYGFLSSLPVSLCTAKYFQTKNIIGIALNRDSMKLSLHVFNFINSEVHLRSFWGFFLHITLRKRHFYEMGQFVVEIQK